MHGDYSRLSTHCLCYAVEHTTAHRFVLLWLASHFSRPKKGLGPILFFIRFAFDHEPCILMINRRKGGRGEAIENFYALSHFFPFLTFPARLLLSRSHPLLFPHTIFSFWKLKKNPWRTTLLKWRRISSGSNLGMELHSQVCEDDMTANSSYTICGGTKSTPLSQMSTIFLFRLPNVPF